MYFYHMQIRYFVRNRKHVINHFPYNFILSNPREEALMTN